MEFHKHLISENASIKDALNKLNLLAMDAVLFVVDENDKLMGALTDGDIRRGFIRGLTLDTLIMEYVQSDPIFIYKDNYSIDQFEVFAKKNIKIIPIIDVDRRIVDILNLRLKSSLLPLDTILMAGGRGERLMPLTENCPKPLLKIGDKPIIEHNIDRLTHFGINRIIISVRYLGDQIKAYFGNGSDKDISIEYIEEDIPLGTFGSLSMIETLQTEHVLLMNSDILTNIDLINFYKSYLASQSDFMVASVPYQVKIPYAVLQIEDNDVISFDEKPTYSYYSNGGIYLFKKSLLTYLNKGSFFNATDFMELLIKKKHRVSHYPILGYWLDIGKPHDFAQAQHDIKHINL